MSGDGRARYPGVPAALGLCLILQLAGVPFMAAFGGRFDELPDGAGAAAGFLLSIISLNLVLYIGSRGDPGLVARVDPRQIRKLDPALLGLVVLAAAGYAITNMAIVGNLIANVPFIREVSERFAGRFGADLAILALFAGLVNPVFEELFFRAYLVHGLARRHGRTFVIVFVALLFGAVHLNPTQVISAFLLGLFLNFLVLRTGNVYYSIVCHCCFNILLTVVAVIIGLGGWPNLNPWFPRVNLTVTPVDLAGLAALLWAVRRFHFRTRGDTAGSLSPES